MKKTFTIMMASACTVIAAAAQETTTANEQEMEKRIGTLEGEVSKLKRLKITGYIQGQYQWGEEDASMKVGTANENTDKSFNRIGIRRGRIKFAYEHGIASAVFQLDVTEKGVGFKDAYINIKDPWINSIALRAGIFDRPFGYEISYSSSRRESPERSAVFQTLFPDERDLGAMLVLQAPKSSPWSILKLQGGLFAGNGIKQETDRRKDFIGHLSASKTFGNFSFGAGASYYNGSVYQGTEQVYKMSGKEFVLNDDASNKGRFAKREYVGFDLQLALKSGIGATRLNAEYLFGQQPGKDTGTKSPNDSKLPTSPTYIRDFSGGYAMLVQDIAKTPVSVVVKYDWYDPNTKVSKNEVGDGGTTEADLSQNTWGAGAIWNIDPALRLTAYYEFNRNEKTTQLAGFDKDLKNDLFTLRLQYKF